MLQDWLLSTKIAKHEPPDEIPPASFYPSPLRTPPPHPFTSLVHHVSQLSQHIGLLKRAPLGIKNHLRNIAGITRSVGSLTFCECFVKFFFLIFSIVQMYPDTRNTLNTAGLLTKRLTFSLTTDLRF